MAAHILVNILISKVGFPKLTQTSLQDLNLMATIFFSWIIFLDNDAFVWPYILASPNDAKHFSYTLKFIGPKTSLTFEGQEDVSIATYVVTIMEAGNICGISKCTLMKQFVDSENKKFKCSLEVKNLKKEAKDENYESRISDDDQEDSNK